MPALHWAMTSSGPDTMNSGEPTTGSSSELASDAGNGIQSSLWGFEAGERFRSSRLAYAHPL